MRHPRASALLGAALWTQASSSARLQNLGIRAHPRFVVRRYGPTLGALQGCKTEASARIYACRRGAMGPRLEPCKAGKPRHLRASAPVGAMDPNRSHERACAWMPRFYSGATLQRCGSIAADPRHAHASARVRACVRVAMDPCVEPCHAAKPKHLRASANPICQTRTCYKHPTERPKENPTYTTTTTSFQTHFLGTAWGVTPLKPRSAARPRLLDLNAGLLLVALWLQMLNCDVCFINSN